MVDKSRARRQHGAGLGMALVAKIAELHGAKLRIESDGTHGTAVYLFFPDRLPGKEQRQTGKEEGEE